MMLFDDLNSGNQSFYVEHNDDIISIAVNEHPKFKSVVATGQIGEKPFIKVWNAGSKKTLSVMQGFHTTGICALDFSCSGKQLLSVGLDAAHSLAVWNWQEGERLVLLMEVWYVTAFCVVRVNFKEFLNIHIIILIT